MAKNTTPQVDQELRAQLQHINNAMRSPEAHITQRPGFVAAVGEAQGFVERALLNLDAAISDTTTDAIENLSSLTAFNSAAALAVEEYGVLREEAARATRSRRRKPLTAEDIAKAQVFFARVFSTKPSDVQDLRDAALVSYLRSTFQSLSHSPVSLPADDVAAFGDAFATLEQARQRVIDENLDDTPLQKRLEQARTTANSALSGSQSILRGILRLENSPLSVDEFVSRRNTPTPDTSAATTPETATTATTATTPSTETPQ